MSWPDIKLRDVSQGLQKNLKTENKNNLESIIKRLLILKLKKQKKKHCFNAQPWKKIIWKKKKKKEY